MHQDKKILKTPFQDAESGGLSARLSAESPPFSAKFLNFRDPFHPFSAESPPFQAERGGAFSLKTPPFRLKALLSGGLSESNWVEGIGVARGFVNSYVHFLAAQVVLGDKGG